MNYKIQEISTIVGLSTRTLRYYDSIGLLPTKRCLENNYRTYTDETLDQLYIILLYRELGFRLKDIKELLHNNEQDIVNILQRQKKLLTNKKNRLTNILQSIDQTILDMKGGLPMNQDSRFDSMKEQEIDKNETTYGQEIRNKYGDSTIDASYQKIRKMSPYQWKQAEQLGKDILALLPTAKDAGIYSKEATILCQKHQEWIQYYWPSYSIEAHLALVKMYTEDERFTSYYDKDISGGALFLYEAMKEYLKNR